MAELRPGSPRTTSRWHARRSGRSGVRRGLRVLRWLALLGVAVLAIGCQAHALTLVLTTDAVAGLQGAPSALPVPLASSGSLPIVLAWQAVTASLAGIFMTHVLPPDYRDRRGVFVHVALIVFFLPMAGLAVMFGVLLLGYLFPPPREAREALHVSKPGFVSHLVARVRHGAGMRLRARLRNLRGERDDRVAALVSVQALPSRVTSEIARDLLADPVEEVRLLAYGILDGLEKRIMQQIFVMRDRHEGAQDDDERAHAARRLAQLYWELIYQNLVRGEVLRFTLERVETFARNTLEQYEDDASMWYLLGRCALMREQSDAAEMYLRQAQFHSFPAERLLPWLAEAAFQKRRYDRVSQLLEGIGANAVTGAAASQVVQPAVRFWTR
ncbi:Uncharacterised protein [Pandoraea pulmonicola]|uniref:Polysaccharide transport system component protein n=1 Tax=Pandoraea pulmonicola TaxID=93221 RepID=A0AAJ4Z8E1_PANPU|nr:Uncharacterised protein [Pandoraea pulmonicola]